MLDQYQFTLLVVAVGLAALLVSLNAAYRTHTENLRTQLASFEADSLSRGAGETTENRNATTQRNARLRERLESLTSLQRNSTISVILLLSFMLLLAVRILIWSWKDHRDTPMVSDSRRLLWLDRVLMTFLAVLIFHLSALHLLFDVPHLLMSN